MWHPPIVNWVRSALEKSGHSGGRSGRNRRRRFFVERLEDRALLSGQVLLVTTTNPLGAGSLTEKVAEAANGDTIKFSPSLANRALTVDFPITINKQLTITGLGPAQLHISDGNLLQDSHIFKIGSNANVTISGLTLSNADGEARVQNGGAIQNAGHLTLNDVAIESCSAEEGGGVYNTGTLTMNNCALEGDSASFAGGAIYNKGTLTLTDSSVWKDSATGNGGGVYNFLNSHATISNCTFTEDRASGGGALFDAQSGTMSISESTIAFNSATSDVALGGGLKVANSTSVVQIADTIIAMNAAPGGQFGVDVSGAVQSQGFNLIGNTTWSSGWVTSDRTGTTSHPLNPLLGPLSTQGLQRYFPLQPGSPALMNGNPAGAPATDQLGHPRVVNGKIDIGAVETQSTAAATQTPVLSTMPPFTTVDSALSALFAADSELWSLLSPGVN